MKVSLIPLLLVLPVLAPSAFAAKGDDFLREYFELETAKTEESYLRDVRTKEDWLEKKAKYRRQLFHMLGLDPKRPRTDLKATVTGKVEGNGFTVENLH